VNRDHLAGASETRPTGDHPRVDLCSAHGASQTRNPPRVSTHIAIGLPGDVVEQFDALVASGQTLSRASVVEAALRRELREHHYARELAIVAAAPDSPKETNHVATMRSRSTSGRTVNVHETKAHLSRLLERVEAGEEIVIARAGGLRHHGFDGDRSARPRLGIVRAAVTFLPTWSPWMTCRACIAIPSTGTRVVMPPVR